MAKDQDFLPHSVRIWPIIGTTPLSSANFGVLIPLSEIASSFHTVSRWSGPRGRRDMIDRLLSKGGENGYLSGRSPSDIEKNAET